MLYPELRNAAFAGNIAEVMKLLDGDNFIHDLRGRQALYYAANFGRTEIVRALLDAGADIDGRNNLASTPLAGAASQCSFSVVELLLDRGASIDARLGHGRTALMVACKETRRSRDQPAMVRLLIERGADITATDDYGRTAFMAAAMGGNVEVLRAIHFETWNLDAQDEEGNTPLHHAAEHGRIAAIEALLAAGANPTIRNEKGQTPYEAALAIRPDEPIYALAPQTA